MIGAAVALVLLVPVVVAVWSATQASQAERQRTLAVAKAQALSSARLAGQPDAPAEDTAQTAAGLPPVVVATQPASGAREVTPGVVDLRVRFSKEMADGSWSWSAAWADSTPERLGPPRYEADRRTCVVTAKLEPGRTYGFWLNSENFQNFKDRSGRPALPYLLIFQTAKN